MFILLTALLIASFAAGEFCLDWWGQLKYSDFTLSFSEFLSCCEASSTGYSFYAGAKCVTIDGYKIGFSLLDYVWFRIWRRRNARAANKAKREKLRYAYLKTVSERSMDKKDV